VNNEPITEERPSEPKKRKPRGIRWCKRCSRKHPSNENCLLVAATCRSKAGNPVTRYIHVNRLQEGSSA
jgi:hypothetical protein